MDRIFVLNGRNEGFTGIDPQLNAEKIYIGRPMRGIPGSPLGNPVKVDRHDESSHNQAVQAFDRYIQGEIERGKQGIGSPAFAELNRLAERVLGGERIALTCWCKPLPCHGDSVKREIIDRALEKQLEQQQLKEIEISWARYAPAGMQGYEVSTAGDKRFSALNATLGDRRTIEEAYQLDVKRYRSSSTDRDWKKGKGKPPLRMMSQDETYAAYKALWQQWAMENPQLMEELVHSARGKVLTDRYATTAISQARVLSELLNERSMQKSNDWQLPPPAPDRITQLAPNQVFVFGSNTEGRHGKGAAKTAMQWGAEYGNPRGPQRQTYAIVTKDLSKGERSIPLRKIELEIEAFLRHAQSEPKTEFLVTKIGCSLAGYSESEIGALWVGKTIPNNVRLPQAFIDVIKQSKMEIDNPLKNLEPLNDRVAAPMQKDIAMGEVATQFIGKSAASPTTPSSTRNYEAAWGDRANTGQYTADDMVMVSGSGPWRGVTQSAIEQTFASHYQPLLDAAIAAKAQFVVGDAKGTDQLVIDYLKERNYQLEWNAIDDWGGYFKATPQLVQEKTAQPRTDLKIILGGQSGADLGGLRGAQQVNLPTGGTAPHGWLVEGGSNPKLAEFELVEGPKGKSDAHTYILRTELNVKNSDGTAVFGSVDPNRDKGSARTIEFADKHGKPWIQFELVELNNPEQCAQELREWAIENNIQTLNIAGNRGSKAPQLESQVAAIVAGAFREPLPQQNLEKPAVQETNSEERVVNYLCRIDPEQPFTEQETVITRMETIKIVECAIQSAASKGYDRAVFRVSTMEGNNALMQEAVDLAKARQAERLLPQIGIELTTEKATGKGSKDDAFIAVTNGQDDRTKKAIAASVKAGVQVVGFDVRRNVALRSNTVATLKKLEQER